MLRKIFFLSLLHFISAHVFAQCCAGGSGSPIAGGASQGVLLERQMEINSNFQYINTSQFYSKDSRDTNFFDNFSSQYIYSRLAYGVTKNFTMSVETGYYLDKRQVGLNKADTIIGKGIGDLIIFPRYDVLNITTETTRTEITLGLGYKIPVGSYQDSTKYIEPFSGNPYYLTNPVAIQPSSGAQDFIFYAFLFRGYPDKNFRIFANALYVKKGWNPLGEKFGDYASVGIFAGKTFFNKLGVTLQLKGERVDSMQLNENILLYAYPNYDPSATGYKKVYIVPQVSYSFKKLTVYALSEFPIYQYVNKTQVGSQLLVTAGISYRFFVAQSKIP